MDGGYEVWSEKGGLRSEHQMLRIQGGADVKLDLMLKPGPDNPLTLRDLKPDCGNYAEHHPHTGYPVHGAPTRAVPL